MTGRSRTLRNNATGPERQLWRLLRELRPLGVHFRRQVPFGPYILDFACHHARLVVEIDGDTHGSDEAIARDELRDDFLRRAGYEVIRLGNEEVLKNLDGVGILLHEVLSTKPLLIPKSSAIADGGTPHDCDIRVVAASPHPNPSPPGEGRARAANAALEFAVNDWEGPLPLEGRDRVGGVASGTQMHMAQKKEGHTRLRTATRPC